MVNLENKIEEYSDELSSMENMYKVDYEPYFAYIHELHSRMCQSLSSSLTDEELEHVLLNTPLDMIEVSEKLNNLKMVRDLTKLEMKHNKNHDDDKYQIDEAFLCVVNALIDKVDRQTSFAKEFIMSCKKVWDSRIHNDSPVGEISSTGEDSLDDIDTPNIDFYDLPAYNVRQQKGKKLVRNDADLLEPYISTDENFGPEVPF